MSISFDFYNRYASYFLNLKSQDLLASGIQEYFRFDEVFPPANLRSTEALTSRSQAQTKEGESRSYSRFSTPCRLRYMNLKVTDLPYGLAEIRLRNKKKYTNRIE